MVFLARAGRSVGSLVKQLAARMDVVSAPTGLSVSITRATFTSSMPQEA